MAASTQEDNLFQLSEDSELTQILQNLADPVKTSSQTSFRREFGLLKVKNPGPGAWACLKDITAVIQRCCQEAKFWPAAELEFFIAHQCISPRNFKILFEALSEKKEVGLMYQALKHQPNDVPEHCLVIALQCFLTSEEKLLQKVMEGYQPSISSHVGGDASSQSPFSEAKSAFVDQVLGTPYDEVYLIRELKKLSFMLVLELLKYILYRLKNPSDQEYVNKLIQWMGHLIDAHSSQMVISKDVQQILVELGKEVEMEKQYVDALTEEIAPLVKMVLMRSQDKEKGARGQGRHRGEYWIETLRL